MAARQDSTTDPAIGLRFEVTVDGIDIGSFSGGEGRGAEYGVFEDRGGGENSYAHRIPGRLKYTPVKLTRPLDARSGAAAGGLATWFSQPKTSVKRNTAALTALDHT